jgi:hypothetical protein
MTTNIVTADPVLNKDEDWERWEQHSGCDTLLWAIPGPETYFITWCPEHEVKGLIVK